MPTRPACRGPHLRRTGPRRRCALRREPDPTCPRPRAWRGPPQPGRPRTGPAPDRPGFARTETRLAASFSDWRRTAPAPDRACGARCRRTGFARTTARCAPPRCAPRGDALSPLRASASAVPRVSRTAPACSALSPDLHRTRACFRRSAVQLETPDCDPTKGYVNRPGNLRCKTGLSPSRAVGPSPRTAPTGETSGKVRSAQRGRNSRMSRASEGGGEVARDRRCGFTL